VILTLNIQSTEKEHSMPMYEQSSERGKHKDEVELVPNYAWRNSKDKTHVVKSANSKADLT
jgi:hypothetical protein